MRERMHAAIVMARRQAFETFLAPGLYATLSAGMLIGFFLVAGFTRSIDSSGFNAQLSPLYDVISRVASSLFGAAFVEKLFAEGPFVFALFCAFLPVFLFLAISSVFRFGHEKNAGAIELLTYGPADGTSYFVASFLKDALFSAASLALLALFFCVGALLGNLVPGPLFLECLPVLFFLSLAVFAYGVLCSVLAANASSALAAFLGIMVVFAAVLAGTLSIMSDSIRSLASIAAAIVQWFSPFYYASLSVRATQAGSLAGFLGGMVLLPVLTAVLLAASHGVLSRRGVRA
ncbi:MAG: hypothetical protein ABSF77_00260 [Spirochaetia bacterium]